MKKNLFVVRATVYCQFVQIVMLILSAEKIALIYLFLTTGPRVRFGNIVTADVIRVDRFIDKIQVPCVFAVIHVYTHEIITKNEDDIDGTDYTGEFAVLLHSSG